MWLKSGMHLPLALAIVFATACGESEEPIDSSDDTASDDDGEQPDDDVGDDDAADDDAADDDVGDDDDDDDGMEPPPPIDAGPKPAVDSSSGPSSRSDASTRDGAVTAPSDASSSGDGSVGGDPPQMTDGECCDDGNCLCHGPVPQAPTAEQGPFKTKSYIIRGVGCVYYPDDPAAKPPYAAVTFSHGFGGSGGCSPSSFQGGGWAPLLASWGIVGMTIDTGAGDQPPVRGRKLVAAVQALKMENMKADSPLMGKLAGRYGTSGFSMGGGGTSHATVSDKTLLSSVAVMPFGTARSGIQTPTLVICGSSDGTAPCGSHGNPLYRGIPDTVPKMRVTVSSGHNGQPSSGGGASGRAGLAFHKVFLEGDKRWRPLLMRIMANETNIK